MNDVDAYFAAGDRTASRLQAIVLGAALLWFAARSSTVLGQAAWQVGFGAGAAGGIFWWLTRAMHTARGPSTWIVANVAAFSLVLGAVYGFRTHPDLVQTFATGAFPGFLILPVGFHLWRCLRNSPPSPDQG